jgi:hypothetical protein
VTVASLRIKFVRTPFHHGMFTSSSRRISAIDEASYAIAVGDPSPLDQTLFLIRRRIVWLARRFGRGAGGVTQDASAKRCVRLRRAFIRSATDPYR